MAQCKLRCKDPVTYSERGHPLAGDYCDVHGLAIHTLRRGSLCDCKHCTVRRAANQRRRKVKAEDQAYEAALTQMEQQHGN